MAELIEMRNDAQFRVVEAGKLQGRQINAAPINAPDTPQYIESGNLKALATISSQPDRDPNAPDYPSAAELGYENADQGFDCLVMGPKGMDEELVAPINAAFGAELGDPEVSGELMKMRFLVTHLGVIESCEHTEAADKCVGDIAEALGLSN